MSDPKCKDCGGSGYVTEMDDDRTTVPCGCKDLAARIADALLSDATDRRGWRQEWDGFDKDIKKEIREKWAGIVRDFLAGVKA